MTVCMSKGRRTKGSFTDVLISVNESKMYTNLKLEKIARI